MANGKAIHHGALSSRPEGRGLSRILINPFVQCVTWLSL
jgi:hypothetical protein